jgi:transposase
MAVFGSPDRLASWDGICPGNHESAGKRKLGHIRKGNPKNRPRASHTLAMKIRRQIEPYPEQLVDDALAAVLSGDSTAVANLLNLHGVVLAQTAARQAP